MKTTNYLLPFVSILGLLALPLLAHSKLDSPTPRAGINGAIQSTIDGGALNFSPPCGDPGDIPIGPPVASWLAGSDVDVAIEHRIVHGPETYRLLISYDGDQTFDEVSVPITTSAGSIPYSLGGVPTPGAGVFTVRIRLPEQASARATLRMDDGFDYFSCADVELISMDRIFVDGFEGGDFSNWTIGP